jgi:hypothetical protein
MRLHAVENTFASDGLALALRYEWRPGSVGRQNDEPAEETQT